MNRYRAVVYGPTGFEYQHGTYDTIAEARAALVGNTWGICCPCIEDLQDPERGDVSGEDE